MSGFGAIGEWPIGGPPYPVSGTWGSTEHADTCAATGGLVGGVWASYEGIIANVIAVTEYFDSSGHIELKLSTVAGLANGDTITVHGVTLEPLANGTWTITLPFGNFVDLVGSPAPNTTGSTSVGTATWGNLDSLTATGHPELAGVWSSTEARDTFTVTGGLLGGVWASTEATDIFSATGHPEYPTGVWASTEARDIFTATGTVTGGGGGVSGLWISAEVKDTFRAVENPHGVWTSTEAKDTFSALGHLPITGVWICQESPDTIFTAGLGDVTTVNIFGQLLVAQALANNGDSTPHGLLPWR